MSLLPISLSESFANEAHPATNEEEGDCLPSPTVLTLPASPSTVPATLSSSGKSDADGHDIPVPLPSANSITFSILTPSASPAMSSFSPEAIITIKAAHNQCIIVVRVGRDTEFPAIRKRIYDKFVRQENIPLSDSFTLALILPVVKRQDSVIYGNRGRSRSNSLSSVGAMQMKLLLSQEDWDSAVGHQPKITLRVLDTVPT